MEVTLGGQPAFVFAPLPGQVDMTAILSHFPGGLVGLDVESTALLGGGPWRQGWEVRTIQLAPKDDEVWVLRLDDNAQRTAAWWILSDEQNVFASHTQIDVLAVRQALGVDISQRNVDTHVLAVMSAPDDTRGQAELKPVASRFGMPELAQAEKRLYLAFEELVRRNDPEAGKVIKRARLVVEGFGGIDLADPAFVEYAGLDALVARRLVSLLVTASKAPAAVLETEAWLSAQAIRLRERGHRVDLDWLERLETEGHQAEREAAGVIKEICGLKTTQNIALVRWLTENGVDWSDHPTTATGAPTLAKEYLPKLLRQEELPEQARAVIEAYYSHARVVDKIKRTSEIRAVMDANGRVHPTLVTVGTVTSRMAASSPTLQNYSKSNPEMRGLFIPEEGHTLVSCDFAQIELRVIAALSHEERMINTILEGGDLHSLTGELLGIPRQQAKVVNFLIVYGGGGARLAQQLRYEISEAEGKAIVRRYWQQYPAIAALNQILTQQVGLRLISGRWVPTGRYKDGGLRSHANLNFLVQGSSRELLVGAWRRFARDTDRERMVWFPIHDEMVLQVPNDRVHEIAGEIGEAMSFDLYGVPIRAEADLLIDPQGVSRWMSGDVAKSYREGTSK